LPSTPERTPVFDRFSVDRQHNRINVNEGLAMTQLFMQKMEALENLKGINNLIPIDTATHVVLNGDRSLNSWNLQSTFKLTVNTQFTLTVNTQP